MKKLAIVSLLALFLIPIKVTYTHDGVCQCDGLDKDCNVNKTERITILGWLSTPEEIVEQVKLF